jgi:hypothetical protein
MSCYAGRAPRQLRATHVRTKRAMLTKTLTTPRSVYSPEKQKPPYPGGFFMELVGLEPTTSWERSRIAGFQSDL